MKNVTTTHLKDSTSETEIQNDIRVSLSDRGIINFRNNIGFARYPDGSVVKYGLCNPGGSDIIGIFNILVTPEMVGKKIGCFLAIEVKRPGKTPTKDQENFIKMINENGGIAGVAHSVEEAISLTMI